MNGRPLELRNTFLLFLAATLLGCSAAGTSREQLQQANGTLETLPSFKYPPARYDDGATAECTDQMKCFMVGEEEKIVVFADNVIPVENCGDSIIRCWTFPLFKIAAFRDHDSEKDYCNGSVCIRDFVGQSASRSTYIVSDVDGDRSDVRVNFDTEAGITEICYLDAWIGCYRLSEDSPRGVLSSNDSTSTP